MKKKPEFLLEIQFVPGSKLSLYQLLQPIS